MRRLGLKKIFSDSIAIAEKDLKLDLRFKILFFSSTVINPITVAIPFMLVYYGLFTTGSAAPTSDLGEKNFAPFLLLGAMTSIILHEGFNNFFNRFSLEKYWKTIEALTLAPVNKMALIIGGAIDGFVSLLPAMATFFTILWLIQPTTIPSLVQITITLALLLLISMSLGLVSGLAVIFNENYLPIFKYSIIGLTFFSCFYYPISLFDNHPALLAIKPLVEINPYYHGVTILRNAWFFNTINMNSFIYVLIFALTLPFISVYIFNKAWKMFIVQGY